MTPYGRDHPDFPHAPRDWGGGPVTHNDGGTGVRLRHGRGLPVWDWASTGPAGIAAYQPAPTTEAMGEAGERARIAIDRLPPGAIPADALAWIEIALDALRERETLMTTLGADILTANRQGGNDPR